MYEVKNKYNYADMAKLADAHGSGPCVSRHASSSLAICTNVVFYKHCNHFVCLKFVYTIKAVYFIRLLFILSFSLSTLSFLAWSVMWEYISVVLMLL